MKASVVALSLLSALVSGLAVPEVVPRQTTTYHPTLAVLIKEDHPTTAFGSSATGEASRIGGAHNVQTLLSFTLSGLAGKKCSLSFSDPTILTGSKTIQVFDVGGPVTTANTYQSRPYRNQFRCTMRVNPTGPATITEDVSCRSFDCPTGDVGFEVVPVGDDDKVTWVVATAGLVIQA